MYINHNSINDSNNSTPLTQRECDEVLGICAAADEWKKYDYIVIDTPPVGLVSDALELFKYSDAICLLN